MQEVKSIIEEEIKEIEFQMSEMNFWKDKVRAKEILERLTDLKLELKNDSKVDGAGAILNILAGAGGEDAENWTRLLLNMYLKYFARVNYRVNVLHESKNDSGGYRNISLEVKGSNIYGNLKNESGVHRLVRVSPFNAKAKRHTSFAMVEVLPILPKIEFQRFVSTLDPKDIEVEFSKSSGPGGQNVNKRETAVRVIYKPRNLAVQISTERSQSENREQAVAILYAKLYKLEEHEKKEEMEGKQISKTTENEWGSQIRNYVLHPYKLIKDLRTGVETTKVEDVLEKGELEEFIEAEKILN